MNIFCIPNSPIKQLTIQTSDVAPGNGLPSFMGYGTKGGLSRFRFPVFEGFRDVAKRHPAAVGSHAGLNVHDDGGKAMDISAKFIGNFIIKGIVTDANSQPIANCNMRLYRSNDDGFVLATITGSDGSFIFSLPNDSYDYYYFTIKRNDLTGAAITSYSITPVQV